jgi:DNA-3-methyladenine glycosylase
MAARRGFDAAYTNRKGELDPNLSNGPGKLCQAFGIERALYGADLTHEPLYLSEPTRSPQVKVRVARSARIGVDYAESWASKPWRFFDPDSRFVSKAKPSGASSRPGRPRS